MAFVPDQQQPDQGIPTGRFVPDVVNDTTGFPTFSIPARPKVFNNDLTAPARMTNAVSGTRQVPIASPSDRFLYEAGGRVTDFLANRGLSPEVSAAGGYAMNLAGQLALAYAGSKIGQLAEPSFEEAGKRVMQSALKPSRSAIDTGKADKAIQTMFDEGVNVTKGGADVLRSRVNDLQDSVKTILEKYSGAEVDKQRVYDALSESISKAMRQATPQSDIAILNNAVMDFSQHPLLQQSSGIPIQLAQELKQGTWKKLGEASFGKGLVPQATRDAQKAIGSGLRQGIEDVAPEVGPINAKTHELLNALNLIEKRTGMEGNKNLVGLGAISPSKEGFIGWMLDRYPAAKSLLAHYLYSHADPAMAGTAVGATLGSKLGQAPQQKQ